MNLFVYGSLRRGEYNHHILGRPFPDRVGFIRYARLYSVGTGHYPCVIESRNHHDIVGGEVYNLSSQYVLDRIEPMESGAGFFLRGVCVLSGPCPAHGEESIDLDAWAYFYQAVLDESDMFRIISGDWSRRHKT